MKTTNFQLALFGGAVAETPNVSFKEMNEAVFKKGFIVHPDLCNTSVLGHINQNSVNYNSTFYKTWTDVTSKNRFELLLDQIRHYVSTYGTGFTGTPYIVNDGAEVIPFTTFKTLLPLAKEVVVGKSLQMLYSGVALKQETINQLLAIIEELGGIDLVNVNQVKNKEAKMFLFKKLDQVPDTAEEFVRYLIYLTTGQTLVIKDYKTFSSLKQHQVEISEIIKKFGLEKLATVFFRYKPLILLMRSTKGNKVVINKVKRLAEKNHVPYQKSYVEQVLSNPALIAKLEGLLPTMNNFKKVKLLETIMVRQKNVSIRPFVIRNGKLFIKQEKAPNESYYRVIYDMVYKSLVASLAKKATTFTISEATNLVFPSSEKSYIGNYPIGTSFNLANADAIVGINWKSSDGAHDLDLSYVDISGNKIGWNAGYINSGKTVVYSGDLTSANPEATELLYASKGFNSGIIQVNLYRGDENSKFKFFIAKEPIINMQRGYMVNPNNIIFETTLEMSSQQLSLGVISEDRFTLASLSTGNSRVSRYDQSSLYTNYVVDTLDCHLDVKQVLLDAGFTQKDNGELDLINVDRSTLLNLLA